MLGLRKATAVFLVPWMLSASLLLGQQEKKQLNLKLISRPDALAPPGPQHISWRPHTDQFSFIESDRDRSDASQALWLYDAQTRSKRLLLSARETKSRIGTELDLSSYQWSPEGDRVLFEAHGNLWLFRLNSGQFRQLTRGDNAKEAAAFSPSGDRIAFVERNNLYALDIRSGHAQKLTSGGSASILNGTLDWVYKEELAYRETGRAYEWSPDGQKIAYLRLDDGPVPQYPLTHFLRVHASLFEQRFPQPGDPNPIPSMNVVNVNGGARQSWSFRLQFPAEYIGPSFLWTPDSKAVCFLTLNRDQTGEVVHIWNPATETDRHPVVEKDPYWINSVEPPQFVDGGRQFLWLSERDGWIHLYLCDRSGKLVKKLTRGHWMMDHPVFEDVPSFEVDRSAGWVYFEGTEPDPRERQIDRVRLDGTDFQSLSRQHGTHALSLSPDGRFIIDQFSSINDPPESRLLKSDGSYMATIDKPANLLSEYDLGTTDFVTLRAPGGALLYARAVKPPHFDPHRKYPVIVYVYGGPHFQIVRNEWGATSWLDQLFAEHGFIVWSLDNRGSWGRGHAFETVVFKDLGARELDDQLTGVRYLKSLPYVDAARIGIWGWSYGGYMTLYALTHAPQVFKCGVAGAPVTDWHFYDSIYTERYMRTPRENPNGYEESSPLWAASRLRAKLLLIHGVADDNVHLQNTISFIQGLIKAGISYQLYLQPSQKHGFQGQMAVTYRNMRIFEFFVHNL